MLLLVPFVFGIFGTGMHFVPNPSLRVVAASVATVYCALLFAILVKLAPPRTPDASEKVPAPVKVAAGFIVITYFVYICGHMNLPAAYTQAFGSATQREYQIESVKKGSAKAILCRYRLQLRGAVTVLNNSFCVGEKFALSHSPGQSIVLTGKQSVFGFSFEDAS